MTQIRVILADDHPIVRSGMRMLPTQDENIVIVGEAEDAQGTLALVEELEADVLLLDAVLPGMRTKKLVHEIKHRRPNMHILILSAYNDPNLVLGLLQAGVDGYLLKEESLKRIAQAIVEAMNGEKSFSTDILTILQEAALGKNGWPSERRRLASLTDREKEVLSLMAEGLNNREIAERLAISERTVKYHVGNIYGKLGVKTRTEAVLLALKYWGRE